MNACSIRRGNLITLEGFYVNAALKHTSRPGGEHVKQAKLLAKLRQTFNHHVVDLEFERLDCC